LIVIKSLAAGHLQVMQRGDTEIIVRRSFDHPPAAVWQAMTDPALIPKWMQSLDPMTSCEMDARRGGSFRYEWRGKARSFYFSGPILDAEAPRRIELIEFFNGDTSSGTHVNTELHAEGAGTRMTVVMRWPNAEARAAAVNSGRTYGLDKVYDKLNAVLTSG
jgi:uncharacterized protein YndB with AHSA1/START domain